MIKQYPNWLPGVIGLYKPEAYFAEFKQFVSELVALGVNSDQAKQHILNEFPELSESQANALLGFILEDKNG